VRQRGSLVHRTKKSGTANTNNTQCRLVSFLGLYEGLVVIYGIVNVPGNIGINGVSMDIVSPHIIIT